MQVRNSAYLHAQHMFELILKRIKRSNYCHDTLITDDDDDDL